MKLDDVMPEICKSAAQAVYRYVEVSRDPYDRPPEYFLSSFVFDKLGTKYTMTLESDAKKLRDWNAEIHKMHGTAPRSEDQRAIEEAIQQTGEDCLYPKEYLRDRRSWHSSRIVARYVRRAQFAPGAL